jgi:hypothetical protein
MTNLQTKERPVYKGKEFMQGERVGFAGILASESRIGIFNEYINDHLVKVWYGDHYEQNHIRNIFKLNLEGEMK